jgi:peptidoglycan/xylan/chitin deacetylase (PgdA/CDA1 family)/glycosyltransferase involved in cell wall biosynthesis
MKKKVLIITSEFGKQGGGLSKSCYKFAHLLQAINFEVKIAISMYVSDLTEKANTDLQEFEIIKNTIEIAKGGYKQDLYKHLFFRGHIENIYAKLKSNVPELIVAFGAGENALFASELKEMFSCKMITMLRGSEMNLSVSDTSLYYTNYQSLRKSDAVIALSNELLERAKQIYYNPTVIYRVIPNIIDFQEAQTHELRDTNVICGVGAKNINEKKGIANLITALYYLNKESTTKFHLRIAGQLDQDLQDIYVNLANSLQLFEYITFLGNLDNQNFYKELATWDFVIQSSFCEGFSNTIGEAIAIRKPFLTTNTGYIAEKTKAITPELVFDDLSPQNMAIKIYKTYFSGKFIEFANQVGDNLKPLVNVDKVKEDWLMVFQKLNLSNPIFPISNQHILSVIFHDISEKYYSNIDIPKNEFDRLCSLIHSKGYQFVSAKQYFESKNVANLIVCTFDDAYQGVYDYAFPILQKYGFTATIFVCSEYIKVDNGWNKKDKKNRIHLELEALMDLQENNWEIGSHGTNHKSFLRLDTEQILHTLEHSKTELEKVFGKIVSFAYPYGDYNPYISKLAQNVYKNIFAVDTGGTHILLDRQQIRRYSTDELIKILKG